MSALNRAGRLPPAFEVQALICCKLVFGLFVTYRA
jgi:hypothetical protein